MEAKNSLRVIQFQPSGKTTREIALNKSVVELTDAMRELAQVEKMTGRAGLPQRVCLAFVGVLVEAMHLAGEQG